MFLDDATAERWFEEQRWGEAGKPSHCPMCGSTEKLGCRPDRKPLPYWCGACRRHFSVRTGTVMHCSRIGLQKWGIGIYLWSVSLKGVSSMRLHRDLNITQKSAYFMVQRLREVWSAKSGGMADPVEADEAHFGGKRKNMSNARRKELSGTSRGAVGKTAAAGIKDRATNKISARVIGNTDKDTLQGFVREHAEPGATLYTDESGSYKGMDEYHHEAVNHSVSEYIRNQAHTNGIESYCAGLRTGYHGTFHKISPKHLQRYVNEFATRHNMRSRDNIDMMSETVAGMIGKRLLYSELIADNGLDSGARS